MTQPTMAEIARDVATEEPPTDEPQGVGADDDEGDDDVDETADGESAEAAPPSDPPPPADPPPRGSKKKAAPRKAKAPKKAPRRTKASPERTPAPTPIADAGIAEHPDPTAAFPAHQEAERDPEPPDSEPPAAAAPTNGQGAPEEDDPPPPMRVYTAQDEVPAEEPDPLKREGVTYEAVEPAEGMQFPDQSGHASRMRAPANLTDICRDYRVGQSDADCYVRVERKKPPSWQGVQCAGYIGKIVAPLTEADFKDLVGGGTYELVVYGPDPRGTRNAFSGSTEIKALTKPITVHHPGRPRFVDLDEYFAPDGGAPSRRDGMHSGWDPMESRRRPPGRGGDATSADAAIHRDSLSFASKELEAKRDEVRELRDRPPPNDATTPAVVAAVRDAAKAGLDAATTTAGNTREMLERQLGDKERQLEDIRVEMRELRTAIHDKPKTDDSAWSAFGNLATAAFQGQRPNGESTGEMTRLHQQHQSEMERVTTAHQREIESMRTRSDETARSHASELERIRTQQSERDRDQRTEFDRREAAVKEDFGRREASAKEEHDRRVQSLRDDHDRELKSTQRQEELIRETNKTSLETRIAAAEDRERAAKEETERARQDADTKEDFFGQMEKFTSQAEVMGYSKAGEENPPKDWRERLAASLNQAIENAPAIFDSATKTFVARAEATQSAVHAMRAAQQQHQPRNLPRPQQPPQQPPPGAPGAPKRRFWASEEGAQPQTAVRPEEAAAQVRPDQAPPPVPGAQAAAQQANPQQPAGAAVPAVAAQPGQPQVRPDQRPPPVQVPPPQAHSDVLPGAPPPANSDMIPPGPPRAAQDGTAPVAMQPSAVVGPPGGFTPQMVEQLRQMLEANLGEGVAPDVFAKGLYEQLGPQQLSAIINGMSADSVLTALSEDPNGADSPLLSREGRGWFRAVWVAGAALVSQ